MRLLGDRVLVRVPRRRAVSSGGIHIPEVARDRPAAGIVVAVGPAAVDVAPGDAVLFGKFAGLEFELGDEPHLVLRLDEVLGIVSFDEFPLDSGTGQG